MILGVDMHKYIVELKEGKTFVVMYTDMPSTNRPLVRPNLYLIVS